MAVTADVKLEGLRAATDKLDQIRCEFIPLHFHWIYPRDRFVPIFFVLIFSVCVFFLLLFLLQREREVRVHQPRFALPQVRSRSVCFD